MSEPRHKMQHWLRVNSLPPPLPLEILEGIEAMVKRSGQKRRVKDKEALLSITAETQRVTVEEQQHHYKSNTSERLIDKFDPVLGRMRVETNEERQERVLGHTMEVKAYVGKTTSIIAREANEMNAIQPVKTTPASNRQPSNRKQTRHPLWRNPSLIPSPQSPLGRVLVTDKFGFHTDIIKDICTKTNHRYYTDTEKVFLATQVNLMLSLSISNKKNQVQCVKNVCKRMGIRNPNIQNKALWTQLSTNVRKWSDKFEIRPIWKGTDSPDSVTTLNDKIRKRLKEDFDLFVSYSFTLKDSAELVNAIHGTNRAGNTISEWKADGSPRDRNNLPTITTEKPMSTTEDKPMSTTEEKPIPAKVGEKNTQVSSTLEKGFYPTDAKYWVTSKGEKCKDCGNPHCQENLVDIPSIMLKMMLAIKDGAIDWEQLVEDNVRVKVASAMENETNVIKDEVKVLRLELLEIERQLASAKNDNQTLSKQLEVVNHATTEKEKEIRDLLS